MTNTCKHCNQEVHRFDKAPEGFAVNDAGQGWATDDNGNTVEDFICPSTESNGAHKVSDGGPVKYGLFTVKGSALPALLESAKGSVYVETGEDYPAVKCDGPAFRELLWAAVDPDEPDTVDVSLPADGRFYYLNQDVQVMVPQSPTVTDAASGVTYTPWTDGAAVGFRAEHPDGRVEFIYLNPSTDSDDGVPNVFIYQGTEGEPSSDAPIVHFTVFED